MNDVLRRSADAQSPADPLGFPHWPPAAALRRAFAANARRATARASRTIGRRRSTASRFSIARPGRDGRPVVLLLHGFPTSSHMFRNLIPALADRYHVIAPDYPGYGQSDMPDRTKFAYTFDRFGELVDGLLDQLGRRALRDVRDGLRAPVGWRLALKHPDRITALIVQNGNAYDEGLKEFWDPIKAYWSDHSEAHRKALYVLVAPETTKFQYTDGVADLSRISPDNWVHDQALLDRPGNAEIQMDLFYDYRTNVPLYPAVQAYFRKHSRRL